MIVIRSERLQLRELELQDDEFILDLLTEAPFVRFIGDKGVRNLPDAREYILKGPMDSYRRFGFGLYLAMLADSGLPIGICGLVKRDTLPDVDVGFAFLTRYWSRGICGRIRRGGPGVCYAATTAAAYRRNHRPRQPCIDRRARENRPEIRADGAAHGERRGAQDVRAARSRITHQAFEITRRQPCIPFLIIM